MPVNIERTPCPILRSKPSLVIGMPVLRATFVFKPLIPTARFSENDNPFMFVILIFFFACKITTFLRHIPGPFWSFCVQHLLMSVFCSTFALLFGKCPRTKKHERFLSMPWGPEITCKYRQETSMLLQGHLLGLFWYLHVWSFSGSKACYEQKANAINQYVYAQVFHLCGCKGTKNIWNKQIIVKLFANFTPFAGVHSSKESFFASRYQKSVPCVVHHQGIGS